MGPLFEALAKSQRAESENGRAQDGQGEHLGPEDVEYVPIEDYAPDDDQEVTQGVGFRGRHLFLQFTDKRGEHSQIISKAWP